MAQRSVVLDTETTGLEVSKGHRIIEIGCVELIDRQLSGRHYHQYIRPEREIDEGAYQVHGISNEFLADKPVFGDIVDDFMRFIDGAELVIHNAAFDVGFIDYELKLHQGPYTSVADYCHIVDSLALARAKHPGQKNSLDALCKRYDVDNSRRELHGALLDAEILADVYLLMTGGQTHLQLGGADPRGDQARESAGIRRLNSGRKLKVVYASDAELAEHEAFLDQLEAAGDVPLWRQSDH